jgi:cytochrome b subunit of formate dehydrogenase
MALMAMPLIGGHMYMAMVSRNGRPGLMGMVHGYVDRDWAKHHYAHWYKEHFKEEAEPQSVAVEEENTEATEGVAPLSPESPA